MELLKWLRLQWDRVFGAAAVITGAVALLTGWSKVSATPYPAEQIPYVVSAGLGGLFLLGVGATLWHSADLRDEWRKLDRIEQALRAADGLRAANGPGTFEQGRASAGSGLDRTGTAVASPGPPPAPAPAPTGDGR